MQKLGKFIVSKNKVILAVMLILTAVSAYMMTKVNVNEDMTKYLADSSSMKQGVDLMAEEMGSLSMDSTIRVMFEGLPDEDAYAMKNRLAEIDNVSSVMYIAGNSDYNCDDYKLFVVSTSFGYGTPEEKAIEKTITSDFNEYHMQMVNDNSSKANIPVAVLLGAFIILMIILFTMCGSWIEPFLFLFTIGCAILVNTGTNALLPSVSNITNSIAALLQVVLSMDYSIILMNRYKQEKDKGLDKNSAMANAVNNAISSIASSAFTTIVGLIMLVFMSFKIGADIGIVLAKGVFCSMLCIVTMLPAIILISDGLITKTKKKILEVPMDKIGNFIYKIRYVVVAVFVVLFVAVYFAKDNTELSYANTTADPIADVFPGTERIVMLYANEDDAAVTEYSSTISAYEGIDSAMNFTNSMGSSLKAEDLSKMMISNGMGDMMDESIIKALYYAYYDGDISFELSINDLLNYAATDLLTNPMIASNLGGIDPNMIQMVPMFLGDMDLDAPYTYEEMASALGSLSDMINSDTVALLYLMYGSTQNYDDSWVLRVDEMMNFVANDLANDPRFGGMLSGLMGDVDLGSVDIVEAARSSLQGPNYSMLVITSRLGEESPETDAFYSMLNSWAKDNLTGKYYLIGNSAMVQEMHEGFGKELNSITLLTALAIFIVVAITFRSFILPLILVAVVQCGVYLTITTIGLQGYSINYLALLIVQCILMGATIDYGILYTNYYREHRKAKSTLDTVKSAYNGSIHTILTSGLIMVLVCFIAGRFFEEPTIRAICQTIAIGVLCASILILFLLPGLLATLDKLFTRKAKG